jgi:hypothetical protein
MFINLLQTLVVSDLIEFELSFSVMQRNKTLDMIKTLILIWRFSGLPAACIKEI